MYNSNIIIIKNCWSSKVIKDSKKNIIKSLLSSKSLLLETI